MSGAIRWADATLFITQTTQMESESDEQVYPVLTNKSDIYSFGSVTLEVCRSTLSRDIHIIKLFLDSFGSHTIPLHPQ